MNQSENQNNYSFNYYNYPSSGISNFSNVSISPYDYSAYQQSSPSTQNYNWSAYQYNYPTYADYNNYHQSVYYNQYKNASVSSSNQSFNNSSFEFNSANSNESSLLQQTYTSTETNSTSSQNTSPTCDPFSKQVSRKYFESTPTIATVATTQTPKTKTTSKTTSRHYQLPDRAVEIMNDWFLEHLNNPYPQQSEKEHLAKLGGISIKQVTAWFSNRRNRSQNTKPKRMKRVLEQEINNIFSEFVTDQVSKDAIIEKLRSTLVDHEVNSNQC